MNTSLPGSDAMSNLVEIIEGDEPAPPVHLLVAHPGHELLAHGWLGVLQPDVLILTDGSGREADPRIEASRQLLGRGLGRPGFLFGRWPDGGLYDALFKRRLEIFVDLSDELSTRWWDEAVQTVICDNDERMILMHDVVQLVAVSAVELARARGAAIDVFELPNQILNDAPRPGGPETIASLSLSDQGLEEKLSHAHAYQSDVI